MTNQTPESSQGASNPLDLDEVMYFLSVLNEVIIEDTPEQMPFEQRVTIGLSCLSRGLADDLSAAVQRFAELIATRPTRPVALESDGD
jgi:hypothetical protein